MIRWGARALVAAALLGSLTGGAPPSARAGGPALRSPLPALSGAEGSLSKGAAEGSGTVTARVVVNPLAVSLSLSPTEVEVRRCVAAKAL